MSRFFTSGDSSSSEESEDEEELYSGGEENQEEKEDSSSEEEDEDDSSSSEDEGGRGVSRFLRDAASSEEGSEDEDQPKVVKSAKDKRLEELESVIKLLDNAVKINDWSSISSEFDKLNRVLGKIPSEKPPKQYVRIIADLEDFMNETIAKQKVSPKKMNTTNSKGLNAMKQKLKRNNKDYGGEIFKYREDKFEYLISEDEEEPTPAPRQPRAATSSTQAIEDDDQNFSTVGAGGKTLKYTAESILAHLRAFNESRGKKNTDRSGQVQIMEKLLAVATTPYQKVRVLLSLISTRFDITSGSISYMSSEQWNSANEEFGTLLEILEENREIVIVDNAEAWEDDEKQPQITPGELFKVPGSLVSMVERLDDDLTRSLQHIDPHAVEYIDRLTDSQKLYNQIVRTMMYIESLQGITNLELPQDNLNRVIIRRLEHLYFKPSQVVNIFEDKALASIPAAIDSTITPRAKKVDPSTLLSTLTTYLFEKSSDIIRGRAYLFQVYSIALNDQFFKARDMLLMSHLQETIPNFDVSTQILYNRTLVQVGLCAFRSGLVYECQNCLQEICGSGRQKELLAQGIIIQRYSQVSPEQEKLERQRQLPFHMHINLELLECVYLTCSMLLEIPLLAQVGSFPDIKKRVISKTYRRHLEFHERQIFTGPPENTRDHILQASRALAAGDWKKSVDLISAIKIWDLMAQPDKIKGMLADQIQQEGLRTYLFTYSPFYDSLEVKVLASMFELSERKVAAIVSKMISGEELAAALDQVNSAIIFRKGVELSRLQSLALTLSDKASGLIEANEKTLEQRTQGTEHRFERQGAQRGGRGGRGGIRGGAGGGRGRTRGGQQFGGGALGSAIKA
ncbi:Translation initiation factor 3 subunit c [Thelotrema lepadinum]|nr:Translation initiation factor 3 subunit c [Thelotrema lepadinum]